MDNAPQESLLFALRNTAWQSLNNKLDKRFTYHCVEHTREVEYRVLQLCATLTLTAHEVDMLHTAAVYHDIGFTIHHENHEHLGAAFFAEKARGTGLAAADIATIQEIIMATRPTVPPNNLLEMIIKDADLYYLSTDDYYRQAGLLRQELEWLHGPLSAERWFSIQQNFLAHHQFYTPGSADELNRRKAEVTAEFAVC